MYKKLSTYIFIASNLVYTFAAPDCSSITSGEAPNPNAIACIVARFINLGLFAAGIIFIGLVGYSAVKMAMALGDPKGIQGGQQTLTYALIGLGIVVGSISILILGGALFDVSLSPADLVEQLSGGIDVLTNLLSGN